MIGVVDLSKYSLTAAVQCLQAFPWASRHPSNCHPSVCPPPAPDHHEMQPYSCDANMSGLVVSGHPVPDFSHTYVCVTPMQLTTATGV
jgi:hypothetical protein